MTGHIYDTNTSLARDSREIRTRLATTHYIRGIKKTQPSRRCDQAFTASDLQIPGVIRKNHRLNQTDICDICTVQEAQLSQADHTLLRVTEYFAKSLNVTQRHSKENL